MVIPIGNILKLFNPGDIFTVLFHSIGLTDVLGYAINWLKTTYKSGGRHAVVNAVSISAASLTSWSTEDWRSAGGKAYSAEETAFTTLWIANRDAYANAFADFVGGMIPDPAAIKASNVVVAPTPPVVVVSPAQQVQVTPVAPETLAQLEGEAEAEITALNGTPAATTTEPAPQQVQVTAEPTPQQVQVTTPQPRTPNRLWL